jgi:3-dehydroquinate dehydratase-2
VSGPGPLVAVVHGVNLDQLGNRDPELYGTLTLAELEQRIERRAAELGMRAEFFQTNHEGALVEHLHSLRGHADAAIINPGAWTHYAWAIRDALEIAAVPTVEIHLSDVQAREPWRRQSVIRDLCFATVSGRGAEGYDEALELVHARIAEGAQA